MAYVMPRGWTKARANFPTAFASSHSHPAFLAGLGQTIDSSIVYPGDVAPGCTDPCAPCAQGTSLYDATLCAVPEGSGLLAQLNAFVRRNQTPVAIGIAILGFSMLSGGRRRR